MGIKSEEAAGLYRRWVRRVRARNHKILKERNKKCKSEES